MKTKKQVQLKKKQSTRKYNNKKIPPGPGVFVLFVLFVLYSKAKARTIRTKKYG